MTLTINGENLDEFTDRYATEKTKKIYFDSGNFRVKRELRAMARDRLASIGYTLASLVAENGQELSSDDVMKDMCHVFNIAVMYRGLENQVFRLFDNALGNYIKNRNGVNAVEVHERFSIVLNHGAAKEGLLSFPDLKRFVSKTLDPAKRN